jgi:hypothetical protein
MTQPVLELQVETQPGVVQETPSPNHHQGRLEPPTGRIIGSPPHRQFILQQHPIKYLMGSMRQKARVKGAGRIKGKDV